MRRRDANLAGNITLGTDFEVMAKKQPATLVVTGELVEALWVDLLLVLFDANDQATFH